MADSKITALTALTAADPVNDMFPVVDVSDTTMAASGTTKKISVNNILGASGTATLASATITGALTVDTTTLVANAAGYTDKVGIGTATPAHTLQVQAAAGNIASFTDGTTPGSLYSGGGYAGFTIPAATSGFFINPAGNFATISTNGVENVRVESAGNLKVNYGNLIIGTSGKGIDFTTSADGTGTVTAELLNDYEEGTFTSTIVGSTTAGIGVYSEQVGRYTKVGRIVTVDISVTWSAHTGTGNMRIGGLPFTSNSTSQASGSIGVLSNIALTAGYVATAYNYPSSALIFLLQYATGGSSAIDIPIDTAGSITISMTYSV